MKNPFDLSGKVAIVTGGARGLGKGIALALAQAGATVGLISRSEEELQETCNEIIEGSGESFYKAVDVRDGDAIKAFVADTISEYGNIDILVNAAGLNVRKPFLEIGDEDWELIMDVNLRSVVKVSQAVLPFMQKIQTGKIINIASLTSEIGIDGMGSYAASKGGVSQLTKTMAREFAQEGIQVNAIGPGYFKTKMTGPVFEDEQRIQWLLSRIPMKRTGTPEDLGGAAVFLASQASDYVTGQTIYVDGGWLSS
ncbi:SDR family NAD(P)-dependent oxidoreductase [Halalkalibacter alkaliphilus]|uniref:Glucose 1-dehydrogenase n=1 Tax=Halalkalibacter alkaliphilus TaxID=2917993 RepID=A0A9X2CWL9_9BACI|nr:glucose 1-dehydrogenase [Halalkalibacter alkaliphilus]MCL7749623.1 glucose 1-dehydrogenase [Halalkalibacter alkaliphilus]